MYQHYQKFKLIYVLHLGLGISVEWNGKKVFYLVTRKMFS